MPFTILPVSLLLAAGLALVNLWLQIRIGQVRKHHGVWVGDAGAEPVVRRMRAQANLVENAPFALALVVLIELCTGESVWLWLLAALFLAARVVHPIGMDGRGRARVIGAVGSMAVLLVLAVWAIAIPIVAQVHLQHDAVEAPPSAG